MSFDGCHACGNCHHSTPNSFPVITVQEAENQIFDSIGAMDDEIVSISESIGRVLREPILADRALPPFNRSTLDGIALSSSAYHMGKKNFKVEGSIPAGSPQQTLDNQ